jgi:spore coat protein A, manganese oxidase
LRERVCGDYTSKVPRTIEPAGDNAWRRQEGLLNALATTTPHATAIMAAALDVNTLAPFVDPLPVPEIAQRQGYRPSPRSKLSVPFYRIQAQPVASKVHRDLQPTRFWSFGSSTPGPTFETRAGEPLLVEWVNALPHEHFLPVDHTIHGAEPTNLRSAPWCTCMGRKQDPKATGIRKTGSCPGKSSLYYYPNQQDAAMLWYHDHALGINRLNVYAGLLGAFFIRDSVEEALNLPKGKCEVPLILYDRLLTRDGQLLYPVSPDPKSPWVPEVFGNAILVNGKLFPYLDVEPRRYRFRVLNASNARIYHLSFLDHASSDKALDCRFTRSGRTRACYRLRFRSRALKSRPVNAPISSSTSASIATRSWC